MLGFGQWGLCCPPSQTLSPTEAGKGFIPGHPLLSAQSPRDSLSINEHEQASYFVVKCLWATWTRILKIQPQQQEEQKFRR